jgi:hypothetical protein
MNAMTRLSACAVIIVMAIAEAIGAQAPVFAPPQRQPRSQRVDPLTSNISGRVTTADTGAPIRGAEIRLSIEGRFSRLATTNGEGRYEMRNLPAGAYKLTVSKSGFITMEFGQRRPFESSSTISVREGEAATGNVALMRGGAIFGRVLDPFGDPSVGTRVQVMRLRSDDGSRRLLAVGVGDQTDDTGHFRIYGLPAGEYYLSASTGLIDAVKRDPPVYYPGTTTFAEAQPITLAAGAEASADFQIVEMGRAATVSGVVLNSSGVPAPGAMVNLSSNTISNTPGAPSTLMLHDDAGPDGTFSIQNVPLGPYTLTAQLPMLPLDVGALAAKEAMRGAGGPPAPDIPVSGAFSVPNAAMREQMLNRMPETAAMQIVVTEQGLSDVTLSTRRGGRLSGRFVADTGITRPLPTGLIARLRSSGPGNMQMTMSGGNDDMEFQLAGGSGPARLEVDGVPDGWAVKAILLNGDDVTDETVDMTGQAGTLRVVMTDRLTTLTGTVQSNSVTRDHNVLVFAEDATKWTSPSRFVRAIRADAEGRFQIRGLPPGQRYLVAALDYLEAGEEQDRRLLERLRNRATSVSLGEGEQRSIQVDLVSR